MDGTRVRVKVLEREIQIRDAMERTLKTNIPQKYVV